MSNPSYLQTYVREVPDFPTPGVLFRDITPLLSAPDAFALAIEGLAAYVADRDADAVVAIGSRGFLFGAPTAVRLGLPFVPVRRPGKLPAARMSIEYTLEYGEGRLDIHTDALTPGDRVVIVDDVLATGGTAFAAAQLVEKLGAEVAGIAVLIELKGLGGRDKLTGFDVHSLLIM